MKAPAKTQLRGICQCCGREQAVQRGRMAKHGYTVKDGWFEGVCTGHNYLPMQQDRTIADSIVAQVREDAAVLRQRAADLQAGKKHPEQAKSGKFKMERHPRLGYLQQVDELVPFKEAPKHHQDEARREAVWKTTRRAEMGERFAADLQKMADQYHGKDLREVRAADAPDPIAIGEVRKLPRGTNGTVVGVQGARVQWITPGKDGAGCFKGWTGSRAWRQLPKVEYTTEEKA